MPKATVLITSMMTLLALSGCLDTAPSASSSQEAPGAYAVQYEGYKDDGSPRFRVGMTLVNQIPIMDASATEGDAAMVVEMDGSPWDGNGPIPKARLIHWLDGSGQEFRRDAPCVDDPNQGNCVLSSMRFGPAPFRLRGCMGGDLWDRDSYPTAFDRSSSDGLVIVDVPAIARCTFDETVVFPKEIRYAATGNYMVRGTAAGSPPSDLSYLASRWPTPQGPQQAGTSWPGADSFTAGGPASLDAYLDALADEEPEAAAAMSNGCLAYAALRKSMSTQGPSATGDLLDTETYEARFTFVSQDAQVHSWFVRHSTGTLKNGSFSVQATDEGSGAGCGPTTPTYPALHLTKATARVDALGLSEAIMGFAFTRGENSAQASWNGTALPTYIFSYKPAYVPEDGTQLFMPISLELHADTGDWLTLLVPRSWAVETQYSLP